MNKKFIALAVAASVSGVANSASIYDDGTTKMNVSGEVDVYLSKFNADAGDAGSDADLWAKIQIDVEHKLSESVIAFGSFEMENGNGYGDAEEANGVSTDDLYAGIKLGDSFGVAVGEVGDFGDSFNAITIDNTNEGYGYMDDFVTDFETKGHAIAAKYDANGLVVVADTYLTDDVDLDNAYGLSASYTIGNFNLGASYQDHGNRNSFDTQSGDNSVYGVKAGYAADAFSIAANYVVEQNDSVDTNVVGLAADYRINAARLYVSGFVAQQDDASEDFSAYTVGADYEFSNNILGFVEYSAQENAGYASDTSSDLYLAGVYYTF